MTEVGTLFQTGPCTCKCTCARRTTIGEVSRDGDAVIVFTVGHEVSPHEARRAAVRWIMFCETSARPNVRYRFDRIEADGTTTKDAF